MPSAWILSSAERVPEERPRPAIDRINGKDAPRHSVFRPDRLDVGVSAIPCREPLLILLREVPEMGRCDLRLARNRIPGDEHKISPIQGCEDAPAAANTLNPLAVPPDDRVAHPLHLRGESVPPLEATQPGSRIAL